MPDQVFSTSPISLEKPSRSIYWRAASIARLRGLGVYCRRMRSHLGAPKTITATAHKLARLIFHLHKTGKPYDENACSRNDERYQQRRQHHLRKQAREMGFEPRPTADATKVSQKKNKAPLPVIRTNV